MDQTEKYRGIRVNGPVFRAYKFSQKTTALHWQGIYVGLTWKSRKSLVFCLVFVLATAKRKRIVLIL